MGTDDYETLRWTVDDDGVAAFREKREPEFTGKASELPDIY